MEKRVVYLCDIAPHNEYDNANNGGYFNCPICKKQIYVSDAESGEEYDCDYCGGIFTFK